MQVPPASVPFVEYVLKAIEHPPFMFVSKLAACCTMLFLNRSDPELLRTLCFKWAVRFQKDRVKLIRIIRRRSQICKAEKSSVAGQDDSRDGAGDGGDESGCGPRLCNPDDAVEHFLRILNSLVPMYFSWNWHRTDYVIQVNKEYEAYVRENILPVCVATPVEDGEDDEEESPWLLSPTVYLSGTLSMSIGNFNSPVRRREPICAAASPMGQCEPRQAPPPQRLTEAGGPRGQATPDNGSFPVKAPTGGREGGGCESGECAANSKNHSTSDSRSDDSAASLFKATHHSPRGEEVLLSFLTIANFREALEANTHGLVIIFHAKYSAKSNEVLEAFQKIVQRKLLDPMPDIAVIYTVAEPELAALYKISWFPTIIYTPPPPRGNSPTGEQSPPDQAVARHRDDEGQPAGEHRPHHPRAEQNRTETRVQSASTEGLNVADRSGGGAATAKRASAIADSPVASRNCFPRVSAPSLAPAKRTPTTAASPAGVATAALPAGPSPTQMLFGITVADENPPASPVAARLSLSSRTVANAHSSPSASSGNALSPEAACVNPAESNAKESQVGEPSEDASPRSAPAMAHSPSLSGLALFGEPTSDVATGELERLIAHDGHKTFPINGLVSVASLVDWVASKGMTTPKTGTLKDVATRVSSLRAGQKYKKSRELHSAFVMLRRMQNDGTATSASTSSSPAAENTQGIRADTSDGTTKTKQPLPVCDIATDAADKTKPRSAADGTRSKQRENASPRVAAARPTELVSTTNESPLFIFLGGGMAAGKSTAAMALAHSAWWQRHKEQSVLINADEFKSTEADLEGLQAEMHKKSTRVAESLLVQAINLGRSIVFDGTMMWAPFVLQVIDMVRKAHTHLFKQGPGYQGLNKKEEYFLPTEARPTPLPHPYVIRFLGITVEPEIAVPRGFLRKFSTGRGVPIPTQLRSFKMFAENFPRYASLVDCATLYNNNVFVDLEKGELPPVIAERDWEATGGELKVYDEAAYQQFLKQTTLNEEADNIHELYPMPSPVSSVLPTHSSASTD